MVLGVRDDVPLKRAVKKRRISIDLPDFFEFPPRGDLTTASQPFRDCVKAFLSRHARLTLPPSLFPSLLAWRVDFHSPVAVALHVVEEDVTTSRRPVYCDHCRVVGKSINPLSMLFFFNYKLKNKIKKLRKYLLNKKLDKIFIWLI